MYERGQMLTKIKGELTADDYGRIVKRLDRWVMKERGIKKRFRPALEKQIRILVYLYKHSSISPASLRSIFYLRPITGYRHMAALHKAGFSELKGSRNNGMYVITEKGKKFIEENLNEI
jgi:DNA-binding MarR family transcriptional regulator